MFRLTTQNLKKQGILPLFFRNTEDYAMIMPGSALRLSNLRQLAPGSPVFLRFQNPGEDQLEVELYHSMTPLQITWCVSEINSCSP